MAGGCEQRTVEAAFRTSLESGNNFDAIRFFAAAAVIFSHSFDIVGAARLEPLRWATGGDASIGHAAVQVFFVLSGLLIVKSWRRQPDLVSYGVKRALRIMPALIVVVMASVFVLGPALSPLSLPAYFSSNETWLYLANLGFYTKYASLPGVFDGFPVDAFNGPLWTLKFEVMCYGAVALLGLVRGLRAPVFLGLFVFFSIVAALEGRAGHGGASYYFFAFADLSRAFFVGAVFALWGDRVVLSGRTGAICAALLVVGAPAGLFDVLFPICGGYLVIAAGLSANRWGRAFHGRGDYSYGLYVWGFPMQQIVLMATGWTVWAANFLLAFPLALACAVLSWRLVEAPALGAKKRLLAGRSGKQRALGAH